MANATIVNFASGETSPKSRGRFDIQSYTSSCRKLENFIAEVSGAARYRPGFKHLAETHGGETARLVPFQLNSGQSYMLEFTPERLRVYKDGALQARVVTTVVGITQASPAVLTVASTIGLSTGVGMEVVLTGVLGMPEVNGRPFELAAGVGGNTFTLLDPSTGVGVDTSAFGAYISGGEVSTIYFVATSYRALDLPGLQFAQAGADMIITHYRHGANKLSVVADTWTLTTYLLTNGPFAPGPSVAITGVEAEVVGGVSYGLMRFSGANAALIDVGELFYIDGVAGMTQLNKQYYRLENPRVVPGSSDVYFELWHRETYARVDIGAFTPYVSGGTAVRTADCPIGCAGYESRFIFAGTGARPSTVFASRSPLPTTGAPRYNDFTGGTDADHAAFFTLSPMNGSVGYIAWAGGASKYLLIGTFGGPFRVSGGGLDEPITPSSVNVRQLDAYGCAASAPALNGATAYYIQRGGKTVRGLRFASDYDDAKSADMCINADQIGDSELKRIVFQTGRPDALWVVRADGQLASCTIQEGERVSGWHRHTIGGTAAKVLDVGVLPRPGLSDQLYIVTERTVNGVTRRAVEAMADDVVFPDIEDYNTGVEATDAAAYRAAVVALQKTAVHLDAYETYNSTPATVVSGLHHLEGETVTALADGVEVPDLVVTNGAVTLPAAASVVHVGLPYTGLLQTQNLEIGGRSGPAQSKPRNINALNIRFLNSKGGGYGTDLYHLYDIETEDADALQLADGSAAPLFNGIRTLAHFDNWSTATDRNEKTVFITQTRPYPCVVQFIDIEYETGDE